ncbi:MAG: hypothetical protein HY657_11650 [Acidobacteria bacterium]|nr:hypothetical protein [Acidobacteriota bacterium]
MTPAADLPLGVASTPLDTDLPRRLGRFRHELRVLGNPPTREELQRLLEMARELHLQDDTISAELAEIRASFEALDLADQIARSGLPVVVSLGGLAEGDLCHFVTPVRFGRRRSDQIGHLELTSGWLKFHGALDVSVVWTEVSDVHRADRDIVVALADSRRVLRFCCHAVGEAARGAVVGTYLANAARGREAGPANPHEIIRSRLITGGAPSRASRRSAPPARAASGPPRWPAAATRSGAR